MSKRVLGDDPFETGDKSASEKPAEPSVRPSKAPGARTSRRPSASAASAASAAKPSRAPAKKNTRSTASTAAPADTTAKRAKSKDSGTHSHTDEETGSDASDEASAAYGDTADVRAPQAPAIPEELRARFEAMEADGDPDVPEAFAEPVIPPARTDVPIDVQIRDLESQLDQLLERARDRGDGRGDVVSLESARAGARHGSVAAKEDPNVFDVARELLSSEFYRSQWGRVAMRDRSEEVDEFGLDPKWEARWRPFFDFLFRQWWRVEVQNIDRVPADGRVILCANHSGALPYDGAMLATAMRLEHPAHRDVRWLAEDFIFHFPFLGVAMNRIGAVRACQENAERLLRKDRCVGVFPEGVKGISKLYRERYKLQRFGRGGHVKLAIRTRTPIVPVAIIGGEETHPMISRAAPLAKMLGVPYVPVTPTFPLLGPLGLIPLPARWKMIFLDPIPMDGYTPEAADDDVLVGRLNEKIRAMIQDELDQAVRARRSVFKG